MRGKASHEIVDRPLLRLFVYGSLKRGFSNHGLYCSGAQSLEIAEIQGALLRIPSGFPVLKVAKAAILARGTGDLVRDLETQRRFTRELAGLKRHESLAAATSRVQGEILAFADPADRLRALDRLEGFDVNRPGEYERVLIEVFSRLRQSHIAVWTYTAGALSRSRPTIPAGRWSAG